jgi:dolichyl-phosphate beta-glucosyltransferase
MQRPDISVILPCYRAPVLAERSVSELMKVLNSLQLSWEVLVVDDGGNDSLSDQAWSGESRIRLLRHSTNRGKGAAVRTGMMASTARVRVFTDIDLPFGTDLVPVIYEFLARRAFHVVIGDRTLPGSSYHQNIGLPRRAASSVFTNMVGRVVTGGFFDTQCGLKGVRGDVADLLFPLLRVDRFAFDVELVYVALKHRLDIKRIPVRLVNNETSSVRLLPDATRGALDILRIKSNQVRGRYNSVALDELVRRDFLSVAASWKSVTSASAER